MTVRTKNKVEDEKQFTFSTETLDTILNKSNLGYSIKRAENPWFKNLPGVRKPGVAWSWTEYELTERYKCFNDIQYFAEKYCKIKLENGKVNHLTLRDYQKDILDLYKNNNRCMLMASRQLGKTVNAAIMMLWYITFHNDKGVMIVANKANTVIEIVDKIKNIYKELPYWLKVGVINWNNRTLAFENGCRIKTEARTKEPSIGFTIDFLYLDEFAHIPKNIINYYYRAIVPVVSAINNSKIIITSTPNGYNLFHDLWQGANLPEGDPKKNPYKALKVYWYQVPGRLNTKLYFNHEKLAIQNIKSEDILNYLKSINITTEEKYEVDAEGELKQYYAVDYNELTTLIKIREIKYIDKLLSNYCNITNWEEQETLLIGGKENFDQEYNLHFLTGSKRLFDPIVMDYIHQNKAEYEYHEIDTLTKNLGFEYNELKWIKDKPEYFIFNNMYKYNYKIVIDIGEGLGQDSSVINIFRLCSKPKDTLKDSTVNDIYDFFQYVQVGKYSSNNVSVTELARIFYYIAFEILNPENVKCVLELNTYGGELLAKLPQINGGNNKYGSYIFLRYKHRVDAEIKKIGLKLSRTKNLIVKEFQTAVNNKKIVMTEEFTLKELDSFVKQETKSGNVVYKAETGNDDSIMTCINLSTVFDMTEFKNMCDVVYNSFDKDTIDFISNKLNENIESNYSPGNILKRIKTQGYTKKENNFKGKFIRK
jgi:hypothetical protein